MNTIQLLKRNDAKRDISFWSKMSDVNEGILNLQFTSGLYSDKELSTTLNEMIQCEKHVANIELDFCEHSSVVQGYGTGDWCLDCQKEI